MNEKILFVDDDINLLSSLKRNLRQKFDLDTASGGEEGLAKLAPGHSFGVVVSDRQMPKMDGIQFLAAARKLAPDTVRIMMTGNVDLEQAVRVVNDGNIFRFLIKPCDIETLTLALEDALIQHRLITAEKELLQKTLNGSVKLLTDILSMVDPKSFGRGEKLCELISKLSESLSLKTPWEIQVAAMLSPIGYVTIPPEIMVKSRAGQVLSNAEQQLINSAQETTAKLLANIPRLGGVAQIALLQNKHFDGKGKPDGQVAGENLPQGARLLKILNDLLYQQSRGIPRAKALDDMSLRPGLYDPKMLATIKINLGLIGGKAGEGWDFISVGVADLSVGMVLNSDVVTKDGTLILTAGHHINSMVLEKINNFQSIYGIKEPIHVRAPHSSPAAIPVVC